MTKCFKFTVVFSGLALVSFMASTQAGIVSISESGGDADRFSIIEPTGSPNGSVFQEDAWMFTDRTHEYNGPAFDAVGALYPTQGATTPPATVLGLPGYLVGNPYIANANNHRDNANYRLTITVDTPSFVYLLVDNRLGDNNAQTPPTLGAATTNNLMGWVAAMGFVQLNTGLSPNGQPDFVGADEGGGLSNSNPGGRTHGSANLGTGPGVSLNQFYSVYKLEVPAGSFTLNEQNGGGLNMYGVVIAPVPEPTTFGLLALGLGLWASSALRRHCK
jgi:hypothetical protein